MAGKEAPGDEFWTIEPLRENEEWKCHKIDNKNLELPSKCYCP
jgi:hypothetical protein